MKQWLSTFFAGFVLGGLMMQAVAPATAAAGYAGDREARALESIARTFKDLERRCR